MRTIIVRDNMRIPLGKQGENNAVRVVWPKIAEKYAKLYGDGRFELVVVQQGKAYPAVVSVDGTDLVWDVLAADVATAEVGSLELIYYAGDTIAKSQTWETMVIASKSADGMTEPPEDPAKSWFASMQSQIGDIRKLKTDSKDNLVSAINEVKEDIVQPDWDQNDPSAKDYVKNRTHWVETEVQNLPEQTIFDPMLMIPSLFLDQQGIPIAVHIAGVEYSGTVQVLRDICYFGNVAIAGEIPGAVDSGEPFLLVSQQDKGCALVIDADRLSNPDDFKKNGVVVSASWSRNIVHKLDKSFLDTSFSFGDYFGDSDEFEETTVPVVRISTTSWISNNKLRSAVYVNDKGILQVALPDQTFNRRVTIYVPFSYSSLSNMSWTTYTITDADLVSKLVQSASIPSIFTLLQLIRPGTANTVLCDPFFVPAGGVGSNSRTQFYGFTVLGTTPVVVSIETSGDTVTVKAKMV